MKISRRTFIKRAGSITAGVGGMLMLPPPELVGLSSQPTNGESPPPFEGWGTYNNAIEMRVVLEKPPSIFCLNTNQAVGRYPMLILRDWPSPWFTKDGRQPLPLVIIEGKAIGLFLGSVLYMEGPILERGIVDETPMFPDGGWRTFAPASWHTTRLSLGCVNAVPRECWDAIMLDRDSWSFTIAAIKNFRNWGALMTETRLDFQGTLEEYSYVISDHFPGFSATGDGHDKIVRSR